MTALGLFYWLAVASAGLILSGLILVAKRNLWP
jgi:hypothetical protein